jgi:hypothetical protein
MRAIPLPKLNNTDDTANDNTDADVNADVNNLGDKAIIPLYWLAESGSTPSLKGSSKYRHLALIKS